MAKLYKFRQSDSFSPRRELQEFIQGLGSSIWLRRPRFGLSETKSRSVESGSPKRGREKCYVWLSANPRPSEEIWVFERMGLAQARGARLNETRWCSQCFMLA